MDALQHFPYPRRATADRWRVLKVLMTSAAACEMTSLPTGRMKGYSPQGATNTLGRMTTFIDESNRLHPGQLLAFEPGADLAGTHGSGKQVTLGQGAA